MLGAKPKKASIRDLFYSMSLIPAERPFSSAAEKVGEWQNIAGYIDGKFIKKNVIQSDAGSEWHILSSMAQESALKGFKIWSNLDPFERSKILCRIARAIEENQKWLACLKVTTSHKHAYKIRDNDIPNLIQSFDYYAGCTLQLHDESMAKSWHPIGPVCIIAEEFNSPSVTLSWRLSSLLAAGNSVISLPALKLSAFELFLAEICHANGLPNGVLNVVPVEQSKIDDFRKLSALSKVNYTGSYEMGFSFAQLSSKALIPLDILIPKRPVFIIYENVDLHSAAYSVIEAFFFYDSRSRSGGCKVFIQESVIKKFLEILNIHFENILANEKLTDRSCIITAEQKKLLTELIEDANNKAQCISAGTSDEDGNTMNPVIINYLQTNSELVHEEIGGPIIVTLPFRTVKESIAMYNCDNMGSPVSIWSEKISVAIEVALKVKSGVVWVNSENVIDARTAFTGIYASGNSSEGGKDGFFSHLTVLPKATLKDESYVSDQEEKYETWLKENKEVYSGQKIYGQMLEYKLYINGIEKHSENGTVPFDKNTLIPAGTVSDVQSAIISAVEAQIKWETITDCEKRKILRKVAYKLKEYKESYLSELQRTTENSVGVCEKEFDDTLDMLHYWTSQNEKFSGSMQEIKSNCIVLQNRNPLGVIGIQCPNEMPLLSFMSLVIPAIAFGNTAVVLASPKYPTIALKICEVLTLSSIPSGVINVISGDLSSLVPYLCKNIDVNALWYTDIPVKAIFSGSNFLQRKFCCQGIWSNFNGAKSLKLHMEATYNKTIFLPAGEIFAN